MNLQAEIRRLNRECSCGLADVMKCVAIRLAIVGKFHRSHTDRQNRSALRPTLIEFDEAFENFLVTFGLVFGCDEKIPRLSVVRRGSPPRRLEKAPQLRGLDGPALQC